MKPAHHVAQGVDSDAPESGAAKGDGLVSPADIVRLADLFSSALAVRGHDIFIRPVAGHGELLSFATLDIKATRLAAFMQSIQPKAASNVIIATLLGENTMIAMLACLKAALTPCLAPVDLDADALLFQLDHLEAPVAIGVSEVGELRPLLALREAGMRSFHLQLAAGFGHSIPDGVANLELASFASLAALKERAQTALFHPSFFLRPN